MSRLILVRHAQASFSPDPAKAFEDYDRLSALGRRQAEALGEELIAAGIAFDRVYTGPALRQRQTAEAVGSVYARRGSMWPAALTEPGLGEHEGAAVVRRALARPEHQEERRRIGVLEDAGGHSIDAARAYFTVFQRVTRRWARGELPGSHGEESWRAFRSRVQQALRRIMAESGRGTTVAAFTSGGPIGSTVAHVLGLDDERAIELAWAVDNTTLTELLFTEERVSLKSFNAQPRTGASELVTNV